MPQIDRGKAKNNLPDGGKTRNNAFRAVLITISVLFIVLVLGAIGFGAGVYLKWIDMQELSRRHNLYRLPLVGQYFPQLQTNFEPVELPATPVQPIVPPPSAVKPLQQTPPPAPLPADPAELEKQQKAKAEEGKRLSRLARLYGAMKPEEAVNIMNQLEDDAIVAIFSRMEDEQVAKILAAMEARRSARLTQMMFKGR